MFDFLTKPKGPNFAKAESVTLDFSGTKVHFKAPDYSYERTERDDSDHRPPIYNLYDHEQYSSALYGGLEKPRMEDGDIPSLGCYKNLWGFEKALFGGDRDTGTLKFVIGLRNINRYGSLFKPKNMEAAVIEDLNLTFGPKSWLAGEGSGGRRYCCPLDWRVHPANKLNWINIYVKNILKPTGGRILWYIPLTEEHLLIFQFRDAGYKSERLMECFRVLAQKIILNCVIEYGEDEKRQMQKAEEEGLGEGYSKNREPLAWEDYDLHPEKYTLKGSEFSHNNP